MNAGQRLSDAGIEAVIVKLARFDAPSYSPEYAVWLQGFRALVEARAALREAGALLDFVFTAADNGYPFHREHDIDGVRAKIAALLPEEAEW